MPRYYPDEVRATVGRYNIFDRNWVHQPVAICTDGEQAQRIVALLNDADPEQRRKGDERADAFVKKILG